MRSFIKRVAVLSLPLTLGCNDVSWPNGRIVTSLRVLGVRAEPASVQPGESSHFSLLCADGAKADTRCDVEIGWFADCNNPQNNDPLKCLNHYAAWFQDVSGPLSDAPGGAARPDFELATEFDYHVPDDILRAEVSVGGIPVRYGNAYVYFAACAGRLYPAPGLVDQLPVQCRDRATGALLDQRRFVVGVTTLYAYEAVRNANPQMLNPRFDGRLIPQQICSSDTDCGPGFGCTSEGECIPVVPACRDPQTCRGHCLDVEVPATSATLTTLSGAPILNPLKSLWFEYYANMGSLPDDPGFGLPAPQQGAASVRSYCAAWRAPTQPSSEARIWLVLRDDRGGLAWHTQRIVVR